MGDGMEFGSLRRGGLVVGTVSPPTFIGAGGDPIRGSGGGSGGCRSVAPCGRSICVGQGLDIGAWGDLLDIIFVLWEWKIGI